MNFFIKFLLPTNNPWVCWAQLQHPNATCTQNHDSFLPNTINQQISKLQWVYFVTMKDGHYTVFGLDTKPVFHPFRWTKQSGYLSHVEQCNAKPEESPNPKCLPLNYSFSCLSCMTFCLVLGKTNVSSTKALPSPPSTPMAFSCTRGS